MKIYTTAGEDIELPNISLPYEQYVEELSKRRAELSKSQLNDPEIQEFIEKRKRKWYGQ